MARKSKTQKRIEREQAERERLESVPLIPEGAYFDGEGLLRTSDGRYMRDGCYRTSDGGTLLYEGVFMAYGFDEPPFETVNVEGSLTEASAGADDAE